PLLPDRPALDRQQRRGAQGDQRDGPEVGGGLPGLTLLQQPEPQQVRGLPVPARGLPGALGDLRLAALPVARDRPARLHRLRLDCDRVPRRALLRGRARRPGLRVRRDGDRDPGRGQACQTRFMITFENFSVSWCEGIFLLTTSASMKCMSRPIGALLSKITFVSPPADVQAQLRRTIARSMTRPPTWPQTAFTKSETLQPSV